MITGATLRNVRSTFALLIAAAWPLGSAGAECATKILGEGSIRVCRWSLIGEQCREYRHVVLPLTISVGDVFRVRYGSNPKSYEFNVDRIEAHANICMIYPAQGEYTSHDRITAACQSCSPTTQ